MDLTTKLILKSLDYTLVLSNSASHNECRNNSDPMGESSDTVSHGAVDTRDNIALIGSHRQLADNLTLRKHGTCGADLHSLLGQGIKMSQILDLNLKNACHNIQKSSGSCSALIVHLEIGHCTVINMKDLNVLAADINDGMNVREQEVSSPCVAG